MTPVRPVPLVAPLALAAALAAPACAETSPYYLGVAQSFTRDSNLLRLSDGATVPTDLSKSDTVATTTLLAGFDQRLGRQRVHADASLRASRYADNSIYDSQTYRLGAGIDWETIARLSGSLNLSSDRNLASFDTYGIGLLRKKNLETVDNLEARIRLGVVTRYTAEASFAHRSIDYSAAEYASREFRQDVGSLGMSFRPSPASSFGAAARTTRGSYPRFRTLGDGSFQADRYRRNDLDLTATLSPSGVSSIESRLSFGKTTYDLAAQRGYSGLTGYAVWIWRPGNKLRIDTTLSRDTGHDSYFLARDFSDATVDSSRLTTSLRLRLRYDLTAKVQVDAWVGALRRSLAETLAVEGSDLSTRSGSDRHLSANLGLRWQATRGLLLGCDLGARQRRGEAPLSSDMDSSTFGCFGQFVLQ